MLSEHIITLILTQREQQRLNSQTKRLSRYDMDDAQLTALRKRWHSALGYQMYAPALLASLDHLIEQLQQGEYRHENYDEVLHQISVYQRSSWTLLRQTYGSVSRYVDRWAKIRPEYRYAFEQTYEANAKLSVEDQAAWFRQLLPGSPTSETSSKKMSETELLLRQLHSPSDVEPEKDTILIFADDNVRVKDNVVDLAAYRQRRNNA